MTLDEQDDADGRCTSVALTTKVRCEKMADHLDYHWYVGSNGTHVWGIGRDTDPDAVRGKAFEGRIPS